MNNYSIETGEAANLSSGEIFSDSNSSDALEVYSADDDSSTRDFAKI